MLDAPPHVRTRLGTRDPAPAVRAPDLPSCAGVDLEFKNHANGTAVDRPPVMEVTNPLKSFSNDELPS